MAKGDPGRGQKLYDQNCASCHGKAGRGGKPGTRDLTRPSWQRQIGDAEISAVIRNGRNRMPAFNFGTQTIADMVRYVRSLASGGQEDGPEP